MPRKSSIERLSRYRNVAGRPDEVASRVIDHYGLDEVIQKSNILKLALSKPEEYMQKKIDAYTELRNAVAGAVDDTKNNKELQGLLTEQQLREYSALRASYVLKAGMVPLSIEFPDDVGKLMQALTAETSMSGTTVAKLEKAESIGH